jgi:hypothetical protein
MFTRTVSEPCGGEGCGGSFNSCTAAFGNNGIDPIGIEVIGCGSFSMHKGGCTTDITGPTSKTVSCPYTSAGRSDTYLETHTLSEEYTTAMLQTNTIAVLPAYDNDFDDICSASRNLAATELSYSIQRMQYKFLFAAATASFHLNWVERFTPTGGSPIDTGFTELIGVGDTSSNTYIRNEPAANGTITIVAIECVPVIA